MGIIRLLNGAIIFPVSDFCRSATSRAEACHDKLGARACREARKLNTINHRRVPRRWPMNINGNHCAVYKPINPGLKYSVFDGVLSVHVGLDPRRVINPINHAAHGLILFLSPLTFLFGAPLRPALIVDEDRSLDTWPLIPCVFNVGWLIQSLWINGARIDLDFWGRCEFF